MKVQVNSSLWPASIQRRRENLHKQPKAFLNTSVLHTEILKPESGVLQQE